MTPRIEAALSRLGGLHPKRIDTIDGNTLALDRIERLLAALGSPQDALPPVIHIAGTLGHFAGDAANPHHATFNYNGWILPNPNHYATDCETHERFETRFVSHAIVLGDVTPRLSPPLLRSDYFKSALEFTRGSNALVETVYRIDRDGGFDVFRPVSNEAKAFTAARLAAGASFLRDLWWSAWRNSANPPPKKAD